MTLHPKLVGIPHIYYINLEDRTDRKEFMENQFKNLGIKNYTRVNASEFLKNDISTWEDKIHFPHRIPAYTDDSIGIEFRRSVCISLTHMETIRKWVEETCEEHMIIMEDDNDLRLVKYWHFDWEYLMNNLPYDWDAIQLMYNSGSTIYCFLHPKTEITWNGPLLINRDYAKKLISLYYFHGKYNFKKKMNRMDFPFDNLNRSRYIDVDDFLGFNGKVYQLPLFTTDPNLDEQFHLSHLQSRKAHLIWWTQLRDNFTLEDFFTYGKPYDDQMKIRISC
jgi:hypothetical protein